MPQPTLDAGSQDVIVGRLRELRKVRRLSMKAFAQLADVDERSAARWFAKENPTPISFATILDIARGGREGKHPRVSLDWLIGRDVPMHSVDRSTLVDDSNTSLAEGIAAFVRSALTERFASKPPLPDAAPPGATDIAVNGAALLEDLINRLDEGLRAAAKTGLESEMVFHVVEQITGAVRAFEPLIEATEGPRRHHEFGRAVADLHISSASRLFDVGKSMGQFGAVQIAERWFDSHARRLMGNGKGNKALEHVTRAAKRLHSQVILTFEQSEADHARRSSDKPRPVTSRPMTKKRDTLIVDTSVDPSRYPDVDDGESSPASRRKQPRGRSR